MTGILLVIGLVFAGLAGLLHIAIFVMESVLWTRPSVWKRFGLHSQDEAQLIRPMALNQGFYNLFLTIGVIVGLVLLPHPSLNTAGIMLILFACGSMLAASLVLVISQPKLVRAALTQGLFPLLAVISLAIVGVQFLSGSA